MKLNLGKSIIGTAVAGLFSVGANGVFGAGFALIEQSASGMGNAYAGAAAVAEDASTIYFNPAGMTRLTGSQGAFALHVLNVSAKFSNNGSSTPPATIATLGGNGGDAGDTAVVPNAYFSMPYGDRIVLGLGINVPFGLATEYDSTWLGRFQGIKSEIMTVNINPSIAYKVNERVSLGFGVNYQQIEGELTNSKVLAPNTEGQAKLEGDDDGWGWNAGLLFDLGESSRVGISYRSTIEYTLEGNLTVVSGATTIANIPITADITMPDSISVSGVTDVNDKVQLLADITQTNWSEIQNLKVVDNSGAVQENLVLNFQDSIRFSFGMNYLYRDNLTLKFGVAYDESAVTDVYRTVRIPDSDRTWLSLGAKFGLSKGFIDVGYSHLFLDDAPIDQDRGNATAYGQVVGTYEGSIDILSVQYALQF